MEHENDASTKEEGEISDDEDDVEESDLKILDEWFPDKGKLEDHGGSCPSSPVKSGSLSSSNDSTPNSSSRPRSKQPRRHPERGDQWLDLHRSGKDRHTYSSPPRRTEVRFLDRHRATPRTQSTHRKHRSRTRSFFSPNNKENNEKTDIDPGHVTSQETDNSGIPSLMDLAVAPPPPPSSSPPLPSSPAPEECASPPPPPPLFAPRRKRKTKLSPADRRSRGILFGKNRDLGEWSGVMITLLRKGPRCFTVAFFPEPQGSRASWYG